jgi:hypothetical protein
MPDTAATVGTCAYLSRISASCIFFSSAPIADTPPDINNGNIACRSAPTENGSSGDQITSPRYSASASSTAFSRPAMTPGPIACILLLIEKISTPAEASSASVHRRAESSSKIVLPPAWPVGVPSPTSAARNACRR